jgi:hypothetical protein
MSDGSRYTDPRAILGSYLVDWWPCSRTAYMATRTDGSNPVTADDQYCNHLTSIAGKTVSSTGNTAGPKYRTNLIGGRGGLKFTNGSQGLVGDVNYALTNGLQLIFLAKWTDTSHQAGVICGAPDTTTPPWETVDGWLTYVDAGALFRLARQENAAGGNDDAAYVQMAIDTNAVMMVCTLDTRISNPVNIEGVATHQGICKIQKDGSHALEYDADHFADLTDINPAKFSIGSRTDSRVSPSIEIYDIFVCNGPVPPKLLQRLVDEYVTPYYAAAFTGIDSFNTRYKERNPFTGPALHVDCGLVPMADMVAMGIRWFRQSVEAASISDAAIDAIIDSQLAAGYPISWILTIDPVSGGSFTTPHARAQQICNRYIAKGFGAVPPVFELGNEAIQLHIAPNSSDFANEAAARNAYSTLIDDFRDQMQGYHYLLSALNDAAPFVCRMAQDLFDTETRQPDIWGMHAYGLTDDAPGTVDAVEALFNVDVVVNEGQMTAATITKADAVSWFSTLYANMGSRPWCNYRAGGGTYNTTTNAYPWYSSIEGNYQGKTGLNNFTTRTATLTETATAIGATLP